MLRFIYMSAKNTHLFFVLRSLKDDLHKFVTDRTIQAVARKNDKLAEIVEKARSLRNLTETTAREIDPEWRED